jgi:hypothetical protein
MSQMTWLARTSGKAREEVAGGAQPVCPSVEDRLDQIARSQAELNRQAEEIKGIATSIVQELGIHEGAVAVLHKLSPVLSEMPPTLRSIESQFELIKEGQIRLQDKINHLEMMITNVSEQLTMTRP